MYNLIAVKRVHLRWLESDPIELGEYKTLKDASTVVELLTSARAFVGMAYVAFSAYGSEYLFERETGFRKVV